MKINPVGVEAYRKANAANSHDRQNAVDASRAKSETSITLPGAGVDVGSIRVPSAQSILASALSSDEKVLLTKFFARFGDKPEDPPVYGTRAQTKSQTRTGLKVDLKG